MIQILQIWTPDKEVQCMCEHPIFYYEFYLENYAVSTSVSAPFVLCQPNLTEISRSQRYSSSWIVSDKSADCTQMNFPSREITPSFQQWSPTAPGASQHVSWGLLLLPWDVLWGMLCCCKGVRWATRHAQIHWKLHLLAFLAHRKKMSSQSQYWVSWAWRG